MERGNIIDFRFNEVNKTIRIRNNNKRRIYPNNNQEIYLRKEGATTRS